MKKGLLFLLTFLLCQFAKSQDSISIKFKNQYKAEAKNISVSFAGNNYIADKKAQVTLPNIATDSFIIEGKDYASASYIIADDDKDGVITLKKKFSWKDLLTAMFYIIFGGIWFV
ncbi:MAG: hypothetical protein LH615_16305, partial [Ferruginibacter sp.]|nr:hypothetical protein [Ferruginibacter sp.]